MKIWKDNGQTAVDFDKIEQAILYDKLSHLIEGKWFKEDTEKEIEEVIFSMFPELNNNLYLAKAYNLTSSFKFHPIVGEKIEDVKYLYHLTNNLDKVMQEGLKGFSKSNDGIRFYKNRIYFSLTPFSEIEYIDDVTYMNNRKEVRIEVTPDMEIFKDPEYHHTAGMVYVNIDSISITQITETGFAFNF